MAERNPPEHDATTGADDGLGAVLREVQRLESELAELRRELAWSQRLATLGTLAAAIAHEVNNALTPVTAYAQLALDADADDELIRKALHAAVDGVARASRLSESVLGLARENPGGGDDDHRCALLEAVEGAVSCLTLQGRRDKINLAIDVPDVRVAIAQGELQQVLLNLLGNARKAVLTRTGPRRIRVTASCIASMDGDVDEAAASDACRAGWAELVVADNGPGIPDAVRGRLFEAFVTHPTGPSGSVASGSGGGRASSAGTGLGLSISRDLVERAGGRIVAEPATGGGAVFRVRLPLAS